VEGELKHLRHVSLPTSLDLLKINAVLKRDSIQANSLQILQKRSKVRGKTTISKWADIKNGSIVTDFETDLYAPDVHEWIELDPVRFYDGLLKAKGKLTWNKID